MRRLNLIIVAGVLAGVLSGYGVANLQKSGGDGDRKFCSKVEDGLQEEMQRGFVNCFTPKDLDVKLREDIRNETSVKCICRRKVGDKVEQINIAQPGT